MSSLLLEDLDKVIIQHIETPDDFRNLLTVNEYFKKLVFDDDFFKEWKRLFCEARTRFEAEGISLKKSTIFLLVCKLGCFKICKYLYHKEVSYINKNAFNDDAFSLACVSGNMSLIKWLFQKKEEISTGTLLSTFRFSCRTGNLELAKFIHQSNLNFQQNDISFLFATCCSFGIFKLIKWLYQSYKEINVHINNNFAFRWSFKKGHIHITKWLFELKKDSFYKSSDKEIAEIIKTIEKE